VHLEISGAAARVVIDNPRRRNALSLTMMDALATHLDSISVRADVRVVTITGAGTDAFVSGADVTEIGDRTDQAGAQRRIDSAVERLFQALADVPAPVIAEIRGHCLGAGMAVALAADIRVCDRSGSFGIPAARLGIGYPLALTSTLVQVVGAAEASWLLYTGSSIPAAEARRIGLVHTVADDLAATVNDLADVIVRNAPLSVRAAKAAIRAARSHELDPGLTSHAEAAVRAARNSADFLEGAAAFLGKRPPVFVGR
jgi:enoyl-CoA hydratase/carnithine racemase